MRFFGPRGVSSTPVATNTMKKSACSAPEIKCFDPLRPIATLPYGRHFMPRTSGPHQVRSSQGIHPFAADRHSAFFLVACGPSDVGVLKK